MKEKYSQKDINKDLITSRLGPDGVFRYGFYMDGGAEVPPLHIARNEEGYLEYVERDDTIIPSNLDQQPTDIFISKGREIDYKGGIKNE